MQKMHNDYLVLFKKEGNHKNRSYEIILTWYCLLYIVDIMLIHQIQYYCAGKNDFQPVFLFFL